MGYNKNMNNNPMLKLFKGLDLYELQEAWDDYADQSTIEIIDQSITVNPDSQEILIAMWYR